MNIEKANLSFREPLTPIKQVTKLVAHHPAHKTWTIEDIHDYHKNKLKWNGAGYNYFITFDGRIFEVRGKNVGAHCEGHNHNTLGICFQGNFEEQHMTDAQIKAGGWLVAKLIKENGLTLNNFIRHSDLAKTACPGRNFKMNDIKQAALECINPPKTVPKKPIHRVQVGAFADKNNAEKLADELKKKGYQAIVVS